MPDPKTLNLSQLRDISWSSWDPIGLLAPGADWRNEPFADEYDSYLIEAASGLRNGWPVEKITDYLLSLASDHGGYRRFSRRRQKQLPRPLQTTCANWTTVKSR